MVHFFEESLRWLSTWWFLFLLLEVQTQLQFFASEYHTWLSRRLDHKYPDDLDQSASDWVKERVDQIEVSATVSKISEILFRSSNAYAPSKKAILLGDETWDKKDPTFWVIAAHELGHAIVHQTYPIWGWLNLLARRNFLWGRQRLPILLLANTLYRDASVTVIVYSLLALSTFCGVLVLIDEAWASKLALKYMDEDERIDSSWLPDLKLGLRSAFLTYFSVFLGLLIITLSYPFVAPMLSGGFTVVALTKGEIFVVDILACLTGFLTIGIWAERRSFHEFLGQKKEIESMSEGESDRFWGGCVKFLVVTWASVVVILLLYAMLLLIWDSSLSPWLMLFVLLAATRVGGRSGSPFRTSFHNLGFPSCEIADVHMARTQREV